MVVGYIDIDSFKRFNTEHGEPAVDRYLLPRFMEAMESHVYGHGYAYRYGGDEYVLLLPNFPLDLAIQFMSRFQNKLQGLEYRGISNRTTISVGLCEIEPDSFLTDREAEDRANRAKNFAKKAGKDRIATYRGNRYEEADLYVATDSPSQHA